MSNTDIVGSSVEVRTGENIIAIPDRKKWNRFVPFSRSWREHKKAQKVSAETVEPQAQVNPAQVPETQVRAGAITAAAVATQTETAIQPQTGRTLAQYPHYKDRDTAGRSPPQQTTYRPYPRNEYIGGKRVLAQYGHYDDKWAVGQAPPPQSAYRPYPTRQYVNGHRVLAQY
ncbi:MAG: hypothetical protein M1813_007944 [Trichoglossum hirsutum]|nr:MAG: hypothetical protein M1813_007944 [Trichoglossum hirsutum]